MSYKFTKRRNRLFSYSPGFGGGTFGRSATVFQRDPNGNAQAVSPDVLRDRHFVRNPVTGVYEQSTIIELSSANYLTDSNDFSTASWLRNGCTVSSTTAADGTTAWWLVEDGTNTVHYIRRALTGFTAGQPQSFSVKVKSSGRTKVRFYFHDGTSEFGGILVDLSTGTASVYASAAITASVVVMPPVEYDTGEWEIGFSCIHPVDTTCDIILAAVGPADASTYVGTNGLQALRVRQWQFEQDKKFPTSYRAATTVAPLSRPGDSLSFPFPFAPQEMTIYMRFIERGTILGVSSGTVLLHIGAGAANRLLLYQVTGFYNGYIHNGSVSANRILAAAPALGSQVELVMQIRGEGSWNVIQSINNAAPTETGFGAALAGGLPAAWSAQNIQIGNSNSGAHAVMNLFEVDIAPGIRTLGYMRSL